MMLPFIELEKSVGITGFAKKTRNPILERSSLSIYSSSTWRHRHRFGYSCVKPKGEVWLEDTHLRIRSIQMVFKAVKLCKTT